MFGVTIENFSSLGLIAFAPSKSEMRNYLQEGVAWIPGSATIIETAREHENILLGALVIALMIVGAIVLFRLLVWAVSFIGGHKKGVITGILFVLTLTSLFLIIEKQLYVRAKTKEGFTSRFQAGDVITVVFKDDLDLRNLKAKETITLLARNQSHFASANESVLPADTEIVGKVIGRKEVPLSNGSKRVSVQIDFRCVRVPGYKEEPFKAFLTMSDISDAEGVKMHKENTGSLMMILAWAASSNPIYIAGAFATTVIGTDYVQRHSTPPDSYFRSISTPNGQVIKKGTTVGLRLYADLYVKE